MFPAFEDCILERVVKFIYPPLGCDLTWMPPPPENPPWWFWGRAVGAIGLGLLTGPGQWRATVWRIHRF